MSINFESHKLDRRSFLKGAGMVGAASLLAACGGKEPMEGWYLQAKNGARFVVNDDREPFRVSDQAKDRDLFDGLTNGDRVRITHDDIAETDPCQTGAYSCELLEEGALEDIRRTQMIRLRLDEEEQQVRIESFRAKNLTERDEPAGGVIILAEADQGEE